MFDPWVKGNKASGLGRFDSGTLHKYGEFATIKIDYMKTLTFNEIDYKVDERFEYYAVFKLPSSNVDFCGHLPEEKKDTQNFFVQFKNGGTYLYKDVPTETIKNASVAESIGKFIRAEISGKYTSVKLENSILTPLNLT